MMEYQAVIKVGRNQMKVNFSDGSMNAMGVNPAKFTTTDFMVQHAIENSPDFKKGRIFTFQAIELEEELRIERAKAPQPPEGGEETEVPAEEKKSQTEVPAEEKKSQTEVEFDNNDDARDYLEQTYGCVRSKLRNRADIVEAGEANGVKILFS